MANEKKTERIVRDHFSQYLSDIEIEEQQSDNLIIRKLLKTASKQGVGIGYPEFIIQYKLNSNLIIVIECKADIKNHRSIEGDRYSDFAVDGVLLYASYLSKDFDVLAIAVSGENIGDTKVSHFLHLKGERKATSIFGDKLLSATDYINGYLKSPEKFRQDYKALLDYTKELNTHLHSHKILESERSLLISCILIALENEAFRLSYASHTKPKDLARSLVQTVLSELEKAEITNDKLEKLKDRFSFIQNDTSLSSGDKVLKEIIDNIDTNINKFIKTYEYFDVLGQLYIEFLRYANSDKGLGIVLTPPHITEFFADIAHVNKNSVVFDNCTGTGGFLISAMRQMIIDAKGDSTKIKDIKKKQLIGVEYQAHIFALAVSNMYIHQDGKSNIINGDCFDQTIISSVKENKPTVGLLNPPYKSDKQKDTDELQFILNNLECLVDGGICVAIVPMQSALAQRGKVYEYKKKLLDNHTLEAVLSMPDELFFNSKVGVVSCIMVFTAHRPHQKGKETYFGYYKDDGFVKRKVQGRYDAFGRWDVIKDKWLTNYLNKKSEPGLSISQVVTPKDEWCAEAYMITDYNSLNRSHFEQTLLNYSTFLFGNKLVEKVSIESFDDNYLSLNVDDWKSFKLHKELFEIKGSKTTPIIELEEFGFGEYPYVTTQATNNGTDGFYDYYTEEGNVLTVDSAVVGYCSYQPRDFSASDHVEKLIPNFKMNKYIALFLVTILNLENYRYNYGRKASQTRMKVTEIMLPQLNGKPDYKFMEDFIKSLPYSRSI